MDYKKEAALTACRLISNNSIIGLGAGSTVANIVECLRQDVARGLVVEIVTSSFKTSELLRKHSLFVRPISLFHEIDIYFDGCDQFDNQLNAVKSGGGIHTLEKLLASMAKQFVLVGDEKKMADTFDPNYPLVLEVIPQAVEYIPAKINELFRIIKSELRINDKRDGAVITENGNNLIDVYFKTWPFLHDLNKTLKSITGVVETSLFLGLANKAIVSGKKGVIVIQKT